MDSCTGKVVITFHSHYEATRQKRRLSQHGVSCALKPVPRTLSSSCGTALMLDAEDYSDSLLIDGVEGAYGNMEGKWSDLLIR